MCQSKWIYNRVRAGFRFSGGIGNMTILSWRREQRTIKRGRYNRTIKGGRDGAALESTVSRGGPGALESDSDVAPSRDVLLNPRKFPLQYIEKGDNKPEGSGCGRG